MLLYRYAPGLRVRLVISVRRLSTTTFGLSSIDHKVSYLLKDNKDVNIAHLHLDRTESPIFFNELIAKHKINFNDIRVHGIGKLMKFLPFMNYTGLVLIKNCGILNSECESQIDNIYLNRYTDKMRLLTIDILLLYQCYREAYKFVKLYESKVPSSGSSSNLSKYKFKLSKFKNFEDMSISASEIVENNIVHIYLRELLKSEHYTLSEKFKYYLLILYKTLEVYPNLSKTQISSLNSTFFALLYRQKAIPYSIYLSYFVKLYPKSTSLLQELGLLTNDSNSKGPVFIGNLEQVNIRRELVQSKTYPYMEDLSLLFTKYLYENLPNRSQLKTLFKTYIRVVSKYQKTEKFLSQNPAYIFEVHPFSKFFHDSSILSTFVDYCFNERFTSLMKPLTASNLIEKFYASLDIINVDHYKSKIHHTHISQLDRLVKYFLHIDDPRGDITRAIELVKILTDANIYLSGDTYISVVRALYKLDCIEDGTNLYNYFKDHPQISTRIKQSDISYICCRYKLPYPKPILRENHLRQHDPFSLEFNHGFLKGELAPENIVKRLDSQLAIRTKH